VPSPPLIVVMLYYSGLAMALVCRRAARYVGLFVFAGSAMAIAGGGHVPNAALPPGQFRLTMFDVGQGDAMLVELPDGRRLQVDTGGVPFGASGFDIGARVLEPALWARGVRRIGTLLLTHGDPDHIGGARSVIEDFAPSHLWQGIPVPRHLPMRELLAYARARGTPTEQHLAGESLTRGEVRIRVVHPPTPDWERPRVRNDDSVVLEILYRDVALLLTGDIGEEVERAILPRLTPAPIRILKVAHHGSRTSSSAAFLEGWRPQIAIISCGRGNSFGHPAPEVIDRLAAIGARVYRTDLDGEVTVETDGKTVHVRTYGD
jgi:competence protein ComEC